MAEQSKRSLFEWHQLINGCPEKATSLRVHISLGSICNIYHLPLQWELVLVSRHDKIGKGPPFQYPEILWSARLALLWCLGLNLSRQETTVTVSLSAGGFFCLLAAPRYILPLCRNQSFDTTRGVSLFSSLDQAPCIFKQQRWRAVGASFVASCRCSPAVLACFLPYEAESGAGTSPSRPLMLVSDSGSCAIRQNALSSGTIDVSLVNCYPWQLLAMHVSYPSSVQGKPQEINSNSGHREIKSMSAPLSLAK